MTVRETADVLHMHFMSVYKMVQSGRLPAVKVGSRWKIDPEALRAWMSRQSQVQRNWVLVGSRESTARSLQALLGTGHRVQAVGFEHLRETIAEDPDAILLDCTVDAHAALAALDYCRQVAATSYLALCVGEPSAELLRDALAGGVVALLGLPINSQHVEQLTGCLRSA
ncbi:MAG: helix-turn-helix domain-containing protein [Armatimonadetes bacterium]|nr:helix-turn-helix domain-containing protein [Armatimonadota bacterium]